MLKEEYRAALGTGRFEHASLEQLASICPHLPRRKVLKMWQRAACGADVWVATPSLLVGEAYHAFLVQRTEEHGIVISHEFASYRWWRWEVEGTDQLWAHSWAQKKWDLPLRPPRWKHLGIVMVADPGVLVPASAPGRVRPHVSHVIGVAYGILPPQFPHWTPEVREELDQAVLHITADQFELLELDSLPSVRRSTAMCARCGGEMRGYLCPLCGIEWDGDLLPPGWGPLVPKVRKFAQERLGYVFGRTPV